MGWKVPEPRERLTMLVIVGMSTEESLFEKPSGYWVRIGLFFGTVEQDLIGFRFSDSDAGLKVEKKQEMLMDQRCMLRHIGRNAG